MALENSDLLVVQKSGNGELRKTSIQTLLAQGDALWDKDGTKIYPKSNTDSVVIGGTLPGTPAIYLAADGTASFSNDVVIGSSALAPNISLNADGTVINNNYIKSERTTTSTGQAHFISDDTTAADDQFHYWGGINGAQNFGIGTDGSGKFGAGKILLNADGSASFAGKVTAASTEDSDPDNTVVTKDYLEGAGNGGTGTLGYWDRTGTSLSPVNDGDSVLIGGTLPSTPNIGLFANGVITTANAYSAGSNTKVFIQRNNAGTETLSWTNDGSASFAGDIGIGGTLPSAPNISLNASGSASFAGTTVVGEFDLSKDNVSGARITASGALQLQRAEGSLNSARFQIIRGTDDETVTINSDGSATFEGKITAASTEDTDPGKTVVTKDYLEGAGNGGTGTLGYWDRTGTTLSPVNQGDDVVIGGTLPSAPNISLNADGNVELQRTITYNATPTPWYTTVSDASDLGYIFQRGSEYKMIITDAGDVKIGPGNNNNTISTAPNITLNADGSAVFGSRVRIGDGTAPKNSYGLTAYNDSATLSAIYSSNANAAGPVWQGYNGPTQTSQILANGSASFAGKVTAADYDLESLSPLP